MTEADNRALAALAGTGGTARASVDDLQGLLLQVSLALLMIFMIAYFIFVQAAKKHEAEEVMAVNRQKLTLALEKVAEDRRIRYGLNAMMTQGTDGKRTFDAAGYVRGGRIELTDAAKGAFSSGSAAAAKDYAAREELEDAWRTDVLGVAGLALGDLSADEAQWLRKAIADGVEDVRLDVRGVQRALAAKLQRQWIENPDTFEDFAKADLSDPGALAVGLAERLRAKSLELVAKETGAEILP